VEKLSPNSDESQRIMPWPSWGWQRFCLWVSIPLAGFIFLLSLAQGAWLLVAFAALLLGASIYSGIQTGWMRTTRQAPLPARMAGGACIIFSGISYSLALIYLILMIALMVFMAIAMGVMLRAMIEGSLDRRR
jgi:hypothetical protein